MTWFLFLLLFLSFLLFLLSPFTPLVVTLIFLGIQFFITLAGYLAWLNRRRKNRSSFLLAFMTMLHFGIFLTMTAILFGITIPQEKTGDSIAFLRGIGKMLSLYDKQWGEVLDKVVLQNNLLENQEMPQKNLTIVPQPSEVTTVREPIINIEE